jgi:hypothetical protein
MFLPAATVWHLAAMLTKHPKNAPRHLNKWIVAVLVLGLLICLLIWWYFHGRIAAIEQQLN